MTKLRANPADASGQTPDAAGAGQGDAPGPGARAAAHEGGPAGGSAAGGGGREPLDPEKTIWRNLITLDDKLFNEHNIRLLTPEARVLIHLKLSGPVPVTMAQQVAGTSYRGFYAVLERLKQAGIVATVKDEQDQRVRRLSLDPSAPIQPDQE